MTAFDSLSRNTVATLITGYQKYISPHKGYSCAHRILHQGESCSQYVKHAILEQGLMDAIALSRDRFHACKMAGEILRSRSVELGCRRRIDRACNNPACDSMGAGCEACGGIAECIEPGCEALDCFSSFDGCGS